MKVHSYLKPSALSDCVKSLTLIHTHTHTRNFYMCNIGGYLEVIGAHFIDVWALSWQGFIPKTEFKKKLVSP